MQNKNMHIPNAKFYSRRSNFNLPPTPLLCCSQQDQLLTRFHCSCPHQKWSLQHHHNFTAFSSGKRTRSSTSVAIGQLPWIYQWMNDEFFERWWDVDNSFHYSFYLACRYSISSIESPTFFSPTASSPVQQWSYALFGLGLVTSGLGLLALVRVRTTDA